MENTMKTNVPKPGKTANKNYVFTIVGMGVMTAVVVVLQLLAASIKLGPFSITLTLAPIIVGAAIFGEWAGAWLGLVFGVIVLISGDAAPFMEVNAVGTVCTVLAKGILSGLISGIVYRLIEKKSKYGAAIAAGVTAPVVNTGIFLLGCFIFFMDTIGAWAAATNPPMEIGEYILVGFIGLNFPIELMINLALSTVIVTVIGYARKMIANR